MLTCDLVRWGLSVLLVLSGCEGLFEVNPGFGTETDATGTTETVEGTTTMASSGTQEASVSSGSSSEETADTPMTCEGDDVPEASDNLGGGMQSGIVVSGSPALSIASQLGDATDEDWFKITVDQAGAVVPSPTVRVFAPESLNVCVFVACNMGRTVEIATCPNGGAVQMDGTNVERRGCCADDVLMFDYSCAGAADGDGFAYVGVKGADEFEGCVPYDVRISV